MMRGIIKKVASTSKTTFKKDYCLYKVHMCLLQTVVDGVDITRNLTGFRTLSENAFL